MVEELSLVISNPGEGEFLKKIDWNKEEFKEFVAEVTSQYTGMVYSEDQMKEAKSDRANLNAMKKAISDRRIEVKNAVMAPYAQFEEEVKEIVALIEKPIALIDFQIKEYEEQQKKEKRNLLLEYFKETAVGIGEWLTFEMIFNQKWLNASVSMKKAREEIESKIGSIKTDLNSIETLCDEKYQPMLKDYYTRCLNITATMAECGRLREIDRKETERKEREAEAARLKAEQEVSVIKAEENVTKTDENVSKQAEGVSEMPESVANPSETASVPTESVQKPDEEVVTPPAGDTAVTEPFAPQEDTKLCKASFTVYGTRSQIMALKKYMTDNNIRFGKVEK